MANEKISDMSSASALTGSELLEVVQSSDNVSATVGEVARLKASLVELDSTSHTLISSHAQKILYTTSGSAVTVTIPTNASVPFETGTVINIVQAGAGTATITGDTGVTVNGVSAGSADIDAQWDGVSIVKYGTNTWMMQGAHGGVS